MLVYGDFIGIHDDWQVARLHVPSIGLENGISCSCTVFLLEMCKVPLSHSTVSQKSLATIPLRDVIVWSSLITCTFFFNKQKQSKHFFFLLWRPVQLKTNFCAQSSRQECYGMQRKKCVCWFKNNGKKQHKRTQVSFHLSCKTSADRTVRQFFHYPLNGPEDDYKKQPEEHGNHCSANKDNELQICFLFSAWEEINEYLSDSWKLLVLFIHSITE